MKNQISRRKAIQGVTLGAGMLAAGIPSVSCQTTTSNTTMEEEYKLKGKVNHSVCRWCYGKIPLEELAEKSKDIGLQSIELLKPEEWPVVDKYGLKCAIATETFASIPDGFNEPKNHEHLISSYLPLIDKAADAGIPNVIVFSGNRRGMDDRVGMENCAVGLEKLVKRAEEKNVTLIMELLNSKVNHKDYMCDRTEWGVGLVDKMGSPNLKLLYDIYHMQIMEGDIISTIKKYSDYIAHYHTGGVPGRNEIDETQELYYPAILKAIVDTGYKGYVAQEFIPKADDKLASLAAGVRICDV